MMRNIYYQFGKRNFLNCKIVKLIIIFIVLLGLIMPFPHFFRDTYIVTIANKRVITRGNIDTYLIYTQNKDGNIKIFKNTNSLIEFKINSNDVYWGLIINRKYEIKAYGLSIPLLSYYQNIVRVRGVD
ncbi:DUF1523 domain-containing protein [Clostridium bowmanii]|uniref:DUF1523 domain-containing protein n=1 Tax=Clostridium bowmanii TaxID=132925 RepID=UPI001C0C824C|nr:DUF1523 domain-containing protein [Clostridium bowmanii]MBU3191402.1 DUF1523 domain-containing protein [Clostridium bowmanii]MCA1075753.1 DUF1523 domain-containing protein [Clostridium bowmanii]